MRLFKSIEPAQTTSRNRTTNAHKVNLMKRNIAIVLTGALMTMTIPMAWTQAAITQPAAESRELDLVYSVSYDKRKLGRIVVRLTHEQSSHRIEAETRPEGVARLFASDASEAFTYSLTDQGWQAHEYREKDGDDEETRVTFEHGTELVTRHGAETARLAADAFIEPQVFPLSTFLVPVEILRQSSVFMPTSRGMREYKYVLDGEEQLVIDGRTYDTFRWIKQRLDRDERGFVIWSEKSTRVPVRIEKFRKNGTMTMELLTESSRAG
jgi:hypothetical protein